MIQEPEKEQTADAEVEVDEGDIGSLKQALAETKEKAENYLTNWQRAQADFINYKRRSEQEKEEYSKFINSALVLSLLPVLDDLERAFESIPPNLAKRSWVEGIRLIERKLRSNLEAQGLSPIEALGKPFDPNFHEAAMYGQGEEGTVVAELQKGYMFHNRILRPSRVVIGGGKEEVATDEKQA